MTGASSGIGLEFARILARGGFDVAIVARNKKELEAVAEELRNRYGTEVQVVPADLSRPNSAEKVYDEVRKAGPIDVLINNAGFGDLHEFNDANWDKLHKMINLNILSLTYLSKLAVKDMLKQKNGKILNVASIASYLPGPHMAVYHATKAYVANFSVALHEELRKDGITVTSLNPGVTRTNFQHEAEMEGSDIVKNRDKMPTAYEVAQYGYEAMMDGRPVAVPGLQNKFLAALSSVMPSRWNARIMNSVYRRGQKSD